MVTVHVAPTAALSEWCLAAFRRLLDDAFEGDFTDDDWQHALGGDHVWLEDASGLVSHASVVPRTLVCSGQEIRVGYVEAVATSPLRQRQGHGRAVMERIGAVIRERYALGALSSSLHAFYGRSGWELWRGPTFVDGPSGRQPTPADDGGVMILRTPGSPSLELDGPIVCDWRRGDVW